MDEFKSLQKALEKAEESPFYAATIVVSPNRKNFLIAKRKDDGIYTSPAGGAKLGETPKEAAIREAFEEANIRLTPGMLRELPIRNLKNGKVCHVFLAVLKEMPELGVHNDPDKEVSKWKWHPIDEALPNMDANRHQGFTDAKMKLMEMRKSEEYDLNEVLQKGKIAPVGTISPNGKFVKVGHLDWRRISKNVHRVGLKMEIQGKPYVREFYVEAPGPEQAFNAVDAKIKDLEKRLGPIKVLGRKINAMAEPKNLEPAPAGPSPLGVPSAIRKALAESELSGMNIDVTNSATEDLATRSNPWKKKLGTALADFKLGEVPREVPLDFPYVLTASQVDDGIFDGYVKNMDQNSGEPGQVVFQVKKMTLAAMVEIFVTKGFIQEAPPAAQSDVTSLLDALNKLHIHLHVHKEEALAPTEESTYAGFELEKGRKPFPLGTMKVWAGKKYVKKPNGWIAVSEHSGSKKSPEKEKVAPVHEDRVEEPKPQKDQPRPEGMRTENSERLAIKYRGRVKIDGKPSDIKYESPKGSTANLVGYVAFGKAPKKVQKLLNEKLQAAELVLTDMGFKFKTPLDFVCQNMASGKHTQAQFIPMANDNPRINIASRDSGITKSLMHEIGHALDYAMYDGEKREARSSQSFKGKDAAIGKLFDELKEVVTSSAYYAEAGEKFKDYLNTPTEIFARAFEVYAYTKGQKMVKAGKLDKSFIEDYQPDVFKTKNQTLEALRETLRANTAAWNEVNTKILKFSIGMSAKGKAALGLTDKDFDYENPKRTDNLVKVSDWIEKNRATDKDLAPAEKEAATYREQSRKLRAEIEAMTKKDGIHVEIPKAKQAEYTKKIVSLMDQIFKQDPIKKAMADLCEALQTPVEKLGQFKDLNEALKSLV